jgi:hypothetical protein
MRCRKRDLREAPASNRDRRKERQTQRSHGAPGGMSSILRLKPRPNTFLKFADKLIGDAFIDISFIACFFHDLRIRMNPTSRAALSGGRPSQAKKVRGDAGRSEATTRSAFFCPTGFGLDGQGGADPKSGNKVSCPNQKKRSRRSVSIAPARRDAGPTATPRPVKRAAAGA